MQGATFDTDTLRLMTLFENTTHVNVKDCVTDDEGSCIYFVVEEGKVGSAIGKNGMNVKNVEHVVKKSVKVFGFSDDLKIFVKNLIPQANDIEIKNGEDTTTVEIKVDAGNKAMVIGREKKNIRLFKELLRRSHNVGEIIVR